ncbi:MAG: DUF5395 family protein [Desulfonauticus sp.]|nr:DUF5395 family protein [Desulfonauticus sp.]
MELTIIHDGKDWVAFDNGVEFRGYTLEELDEKVKAYVLESENFASQKEVRVWMYFNTAVIPEWMRQYMQHYFNRVLVVRREH